MRGLRLPRCAWRPCSVSAAATPRASSSRSTGSPGAAAVVSVSYKPWAAPSVCCTQRFYSTVHKKQSTIDDVRRHGSTDMGASATSDATSDDAMDLIWSVMPDAHEQCREATLASIPHEHAAAKSTCTTTTSPREGDQASDANGTAASSPAPPVSYVWVSMHNLPRNWLHEDIVELIHQVAEHAGVATPVASSTPHPASSQEGDAAAAADDDDGDEEGCTGDGNSSFSNHTPSPFVCRLHIPFGRRTGLVYGSPTILLTSPQLADYLIHKLTFDPDDFRSRVYFTRTTPEELPSGYQQEQQHPCERAGAGGEAASSDGRARITYTPVEETVEREQDEALRTLELDRYLFAPDLLLDIVKSHQRRLVTKNEKVLLGAFLDGEEDSDEGEDEDEEDKAGREAEEEEEDAVRGDSDAERAAMSITRRRRQRRQTTSSSGVRKTKKLRPARRRVRAGTQKHLGRGSMHNMPIPKPYVEGRKL